MMTIIAIILGLGLFALVVGVAFWFANEEQKTIKPEPELDDDTRQARRESASSIARINMPDYLCGAYRLSVRGRQGFLHGQSEEDITSRPPSSAEHQPDQSNAAKHLGQVFATTEAEAIKEAVKEFDVAEALRDRIVARKENY